MDIYNFIIQNKELFKILYALIIVFICVLIVIKTNKLFSLSSHTGIRYFRNAFFFYGIAFTIRYLFKFFVDKTFLINILFEFFLVMAGFFLLYSLLWKRFEPSKLFPFSSLFNAKISIFYALAIIISFLDYLWHVPYFMFFSQIILFVFASVISYINYRKSKEPHKFPKFYFIAIVLILLAWILNALAAIYFQWNQVVMINIYIFNAVFFLLFLYGVIKVIKN